MIDVHKIGVALAMTSRGLPGVLIVTEREVRQLRRHRPENGASPGSRCQEAEARRGKAET
jgi:hypothetical protein